MACRKLWDVGVYVAVTSVAPLRVYVYDNLLLRHCTENYNRDLKNAHPDSYIIAEDYAPPWAIKTLRPYYVRGFSTANVLRAFMKDQGVPRAVPSHLATPLVRPSGSVTHGRSGCRCRL